MMPTNSREGISLKACWRLVFLHPIAPSLTVYLGFSMHRKISMRLPSVVACSAFFSLVFAGCSPYVGIGIPVGPFSMAVGVGSGGVSAGVGTGIGPVGVGVGVNQNGQVTGSTDVGVGTSVGGANVGVGVGTGAVLYDPAAPKASANAEADAPTRAAAGNATSASGPMVESGVVVPANSSRPAEPGNSPNPAVAPSPVADTAVQWRGADGQAVPDCKFRNVC